MGDPKKQRKKYKTPSHPWQKDRIDSEKEILKGYGLKNKKEIWKMESVLRNFRQQAKKLVAQDNVQVNKEREQLLNKLVGLSLLNPGAKIENVLDLELKDIMDRRLQTQVFKQGLAKTMKQARQFITHKHISIKDKKIDVPSYLVTKEDEFKINFSDNSDLSDDTHPERIKKKVQKLKEEVEKIEKKEIKKEKTKEVKEEKVKEEKKEEVKPKEVVEESKKEEEKAEDKKEEVKIKEETPEVKEEELTENLEKVEKKLI